MICLKSYGERDYAGKPTHILNPYKLSRIYTEYDGCVWRVIGDIVDFLGTPKGETRARRHYLSKSCENFSDADAKRKELVGSLRCYFVDVFERCSSESLESLLAHNICEFSVEEVKAHPSSVWQVVGFVGTGKKFYLSSPYDSEEEAWNKAEKIAGDMAEQDTWDYEPPTSMYDTIGG
ncbi:MAG: hypothetical protein OXU73_02225 [Candidatus Campbellbacteria bacterium]|nr:hypothetical protein [Candidatus Campbellbacteria bacterium]